MILYLLLINISFDDNYSGLKNRVVYRSGSFPHPFHGHLMRPFFCMFIAMGMGRLRHEHHCEHPKHKSLDGSNE